MIMEIKSALEGRDVCDEMRRELRRVRYNPDLIKMHRNIENMVTEISKLEVYCRRPSQRDILNEPLSKLNESVKHLKNLILMAKLMD